MKNLVLLLMISALFFQHVTAQKYGSKPSEQFGHTLNIGAGVGYHRYLNYPTPVVVINYEFDLVRNITLAPIIGVSTYRDSHYWGNYNNAYRDYHYRQTAISIGIKGSYYFDELLMLNTKWDVYTAASIGVQPVITTWDNGYYGNKKLTNTPGLVFASGHLGARYHFSKRVGVFVDLSTGIFTTGGSFKL